MTDRRPQPEPPGAAGTDAGFAAVAAVLWREREVLDRLLFALVTQQLVLRDGQLRWLPATDERVGSALDALRDLALLRGIELDEIANRSGFPADISLAELAERAPAPWDELLAEHRTALRATVAEISATAAENTRLLQAGAEAARETLAQVGRVSAGYDRDGAAVNLPVGAVLLDRHA